MPRFFNTTGFCHPDKHYMVDPLRGFYPAILQLIRQENYLLLHAPRQTGKTTLLHALAHRLNAAGQHTACVFSVETAGVPSFTEQLANERMVNALYSASPLFLPEAERPPQPVHPISLKDYLNLWARSQPKPLVLLVDEVDALYDDVLVSFLRQLRDGFQLRPTGFPASVALVGLRDIREYRFKARADNPSLGAGSPFNVKARSYLLPFFTKEEVDTLLQQHTDDTGQAFSPEVRAKIFEYSGGQPWLTNALAREIVSDILHDDYTQPIAPAHVEQAKENLIQRRDTHLDSLLDKLKESRVRNVVMAVINGNPPQFDDYDDAIRYCRDLGIVTSGRPVRFASPIYKEIVVRTLNSVFHDGFENDLVETPFYLHPDGSLDMDKLLRAFTAFYRRHSESWLERYDYKEAGHQLLLMAFLQRIVNGGGRIEREMALGNGRTDVAVFWQDQVIAVELKMRHDNQSRADGLRQITGYLDRLGQQHGYLVLFDQRPVAELPWDERIRWTDEEHAGKQVTVIEL